VSGGFDGIQEFLTAMALKIRLSQKFGLYNILAQLSISDIVPVGANEGQNR
jgi:hypothetical protein